MNVYSLSLAELKIPLKNWVVLRQGDNAAAWSVVDTTTSAFRYLRIRQTGDNVHVDETKRNVLFLSGFEVFGTLLEST